MNHKVLSFSFLFLGLLLLPFPLRFFLLHEGLWSLGYGGVFLSLPSLCLLLAGFFFVCASPPAASLSSRNAVLLLSLGALLVGVLAIVPYPLTFFFFLLLLFQGGILCWLLFSFRERIHVLFLALLLGAGIEVGLATIQVLFPYASFSFFGMTLSPLVPEVAKIQVQGVAFLRGYGSFLHPNILGAYLALVLLLSPLFLRQTWVKYGWGGVLLFGILLTGSKAAFLFVLLLLLLSVRRWMLSILALGLGLLLFLPKLLSLYGPGFFFERLDGYMSFLKGMLFLPIGSGAFSVLPLYDGLSPVLLRPWELVPPHNIFLLLFAEYGVVLGIVFLSILAVLCYWTYKRVPYRKRPYFYSMCLYLLVFGSVDHYFLTSFPGFFFPLLLVGFLSPLLFQRH